MRRQDDWARQQATLHHSLRGYSMTHMAPKLYQGARPPQGPGLAASGFGMLVLCALEHQPPSSAFPGVDVIHLPFDDCRELPEDVLKAAAEVAKIEVKQIAAGRRVLNTCNMGVNRSGVVTALAMYHLRLRLESKRPNAKWMAQVIKHIQATRFHGELHGLCNPWFAQALHEWAKGQ